MTSYDIHRGVGKTPEILGLSEKYLGYLGLCLLAGFGAFAGCRIAGQTPFVSSVVLIAICVTAFLYLQRMAVRHGDHGVAKLSAYRRRPRIVVASSRAVFLNLKRTRRGRH